MPSGRFDLLGPVRRFVGSTVRAALQAEAAKMPAGPVPERLDGPGWQTYAVNVRSQMAEIKTPEQSYRLVSWINRAVGSLIESSRRAELLVYKPRRREMARELGWSVKAKAEGEVLTPVSGPMELLNNPLRDFSCGFDELYEQTCGHFLLRGWVGWFCPLGTAKHPVSIQIVPRGAVNQFVIQDGKLTGYQIRRGAELLDVKAEEMCVLKRWNPESPIEGLSAIEAVMLAADADRAQSQAAKTMARRGPNQQGFLTSDSPDFTEEDARAAQAMFESRYGGPEESYRTPVVTSGLKWEKTGLSLRELGFLDTRRFGREEIGGIFGVPPIKMGDWSNSYYNSREQSRSFWLDGIEPLLKRFKRFLDSQFLAYWDQAYVSDWDTADIAELQDDRVELANVASQLVVNRIASPNEVRDEFWGWKPYPGGDDILAGLGLVPVGSSPVSKPEAGPAVQRAADGVNDAYRALLLACQPQARNRIKGLEIPNTPEALVRWWKLLDSIMAPQAKRLGSLVRSRVMEDFIAPVSAAIRDHSSDPAVVLDRRVLAAKLTEKSLPLVRSFYEQAGERAESVAGAKALALKFDLNAERLAKIHAMVEDWADVTTDGLIKGVKDNIAQALLSGADLAASHDEIIAALKDVLGSEYRAELCSRTIVQGANNGATREGWRESGVVDGKRWLAGPPGPRRRPVHQEMSAKGEIYGLDEPFVLPNGATGQNPGAMSPMDENYNCGCVMVAALKALPTGG